MEYLKNDMYTSNKIVMMKDLLQKQILNNEKRNIILKILNYLEYQHVNNQDDIHLQNEIKILYDCIL